MSKCIDTRTEEPEWLLPFEGMAVGDSFFIPSLHAAELLYVVETRAKKAKIRIRAYLVMKDGIQGVRAWRTA